jgi:hypothetical protein
MNEHIAYLPPLRPRLRVSIARSRREGDVLRIERVHFYNPPDARPRSSGMPNPPRVGEIILELPIGMLPELQEAIARADDIARQLLSDAAA